MVVGAASRIELAALGAQLPSCLTIGQLEQQLGVVVITLPTPMQDDLVSLVQRVDARQQLGELLSRYGMAVDDRDFDTLGQLFAPDGEFHGVVGRAQIVDYYRARTATFTTSSHYALTWHFDFESDVLARGVVNAHAELCIGGKTVRLALRYLDRYVKQEGRWMFLVRHLKFRYVLAFDEVAHGLDDPMRVRWPGSPAQRADLPESLPTYLDSRRAQGPPAVPPNT